MDENSTIDLMPYQGAGPLRFGMTRGEVTQVVGIPDSLSRNFKGDLVEFRSFMNLGYSREADTLNHIGFGRQMQGVQYEGILLFAQDAIQVLRELVMLDGAPQSYLGFIVLLNLGMTLTGFHDNEASQRAIALFPRGAWDGRLDKLRAFSL